ncbi:MAG: hypothetical protein J2P36_07755 [Ktedonobacteraceae bacterium]|nr:hypothetical protein [Ktedonobacteraceae bacterium]
MGLNREEPVVLVVSTLVIASLFQPVRKRIQTFIDRRFYRQKYDTEKALAAFSAILHTEVDLSHLREQLLILVQQTMQPTSLSLWLISPNQQASEEGAGGEAPLHGGDRAQEK